MFANAVAREPEPFDSRDGWRKRDEVFDHFCDAARANPDELEMLTMLFDEGHISDAEVESHSVDELIAVVERILAGVTTDAEVDEDGFGYAWIVPSVTFQNALAMTTTREPMRSFVRTRSSGRASRSRRTRPSRTSHGPPGRRRASPSGAS